MDVFIVEAIRAMVGGESLAWLDCVESTGLAEAGQVEAMGHVRNLILIP